MPKKAVFLITLLTLAACFLSYTLGSTPVALANRRAGVQNEAAQAQPPLASPPGTWVLTSAAQGSTPASVTKAAASGVQHVVTCVSASVWFNGASDYGSFRLLLRDGPSGTGNIIMQWWENMPAATGGNAQLYTFSQCDINVVGNADSAMTLEFDRIDSPVMLQTVNLVGYDAT
jgi:hypothetical protein